MRKIIFLLVGIAALAAADAPTAQHSDEAAATIDAGKLPSGYRDWRLISIAHEEGDLHSIGAALGNDVAIKAFREKTLPFPDGTIIAALHYKHVPSDENNKIFGQEQSFVAGAPTNTQFMIKDSQKYAATGGWGFFHFTDGKPLTNKATIQSCYDCHAKYPDHDLVFTQYAP